MTSCHSEHMDANKIQEWLKQGAEMVRAHEADPIEMLGHIRMLKKALPDAEAKVEPIALLEADRLGGKEVYSGGYKFRRSEGAKKWNHSQNPTIMALEASMQPTLMDIEAEKKKGVIAASLVMEQPLRYAVDENGYAYDKQTGDCIGFVPEILPTKPSLTLVKE